MKVALVVSWLNQYGGAERVLDVLHDLYPQAPVYTSMYDPVRMPAAYRAWDIRPSFLQRVPLTRSHHQLFLPFYPFAFESLDLRGYDLVISNTSAFAHGVVTRPETTHVCYCLTPARFLWQYEEYVERERLGRLPRLFLPALIPALRQWDRVAADRVDHFVAISRLVARRIAKFYRRPAEVIYPPVAVTRFTPVPDHDDYFLSVGRLIPYKRVDLAVAAFNQTGLPLLIVGDGRDRPTLEQMAQPNVRFLGRLPDDEMRRLMARCRAFIFPGEEDFGITPLEAQAAGRPVIAYAGGGALETIVEGETGLFFREQTPESLADVVRRFDDRQFDPARIRANAERFDVARFREKLTALLARLLPSTTGHAVSNIA